MVCLVGRNFQTGYQKLHSVPHPAHAFGHLPEDAPLADAEVARRAGLSERRFGHYVRGNREPDFATLMRICADMDVTPNELLLAEKPARLPAQDRWLARLLAAGRTLGVKTSSWL